MLTIDHSVCSVGSRPHKIRIPFGELTVDIQRKIRLNGYADDPTLTKELRPGEIKIIPNPPMPLPASAELVYATIEEDSNHSVGRFNTALRGLLSELFPRRYFNRTSLVSLTEVERMGARSPIWFQTKQASINVAYCPPGSYYGPVLVPMIHVRVYDPEEAKPVADLLQRQRFSPKISNREGRWDIDSLLVSANAPKRQYEVPARL